MLPLTKDACGYYYWCRRKGGWRIGPVIDPVESRMVSGTRTGKTLGSVMHTTAAQAPLVAAKLSRLPTCWRQWGALLSGSAREIRTCTICVSLNKQSLSAARGRSYRGWLASVLSASKAKIPSPPARKLEPHFIVLYFASRSTALPKRQLLSSSQILGSANCDFGYGP